MPIAGGCNLDAARAKAGWAKIEKTCELARSSWMNLKYAWVDSCCIDKSSSTELSEAINSMFAWYRDSAVCYVYLEDLAPIPNTLKYSYGATQAYLDKHLGQCRWFHRGFTLQELIASQTVAFYDQDWKFVGTKLDLEEILCCITRIDVRILRDSSGLRHIPIARRMSWAAGRKTTPQEDIAYCLLGIFDVNMPLLYGEGTKAFLRFQEHLASQSNDLSLFAWQCEEEDCKNKKDNGFFSGIFADSPANFYHCSSLKRHRDQFQFQNEFTITNNGLRMEAIVRKLRYGASIKSSEVNKADYLLDLDCVETSRRTDYVPKWLAISLTRVGSIFVRARPYMVFTDLSRSGWTTHGERLRLYISQTLPSPEIIRIESFIGAELAIEFDDTLRRVIKEQAVAPRAAIENRNRVIFDCHGQDNFLGMVTFKFSTRAFSFGWNEKIYVAVCGLQWNGCECEPWICFLDEKNSTGTENSPIVKTGMSRAQTGITKFSVEAKSMDSRIDADVREVKDLMLRLYSDEAGLLMPKMMPREIAFEREQQSHRLIARRADDHMNDNAGGLGFRIKRRYTFS